MGNGLFNLIKQVSVFVVCAQMILHFKPTEQYGKYIKLLIGLMVLVQLFVPLMSLIGKEGANVFSERMEYYQRIVADSMADAGLDGVATAERVEEMRLAEIKSILNNAEWEGVAESDNPEGEKTVLSQAPEGRESLITAGESTEETAVQQDSGQDGIYIERIEVGPDE
ncbi:MAG: hypothetical protein IJX66_12105 [Lachnospiraceae bacterium]|nr:hypothetical protein [Lachnospiraceae bacterium]